MGQRLKKIEDITMDVKRDGVRGEARSKPVSVVKIGNGNKNCNIL